MIKCQKTHQPKQQHEETAWWSLLSLLAFAGRDIGLKKFLGGRFSSLWHTAFKMAHRCPQNPFRPPKVPATDIWCERFEVWRKFDTDGSPKNQAKKCDFSDFSKLSVSGEPLVKLWGVCRKNCWPLFLRVFTFDQRRIESGYIWVIYDHLLINSTVPQVCSLPFCNMRFSPWSMLEPE